MKQVKSNAGPGKWIVRAIGALVITLSLVFTLSLAASAEEADGQAQESGAEVGEQGFFGSAAAFLTEHLPLLLSTLTLLGTAALARLFRSSLLPILDSGMKRVGGGVEALEGKTRALLEASEHELSELSALVTRLADASGAEGERLSLLRSEIDGSMRSLADSVRLEAARLDAVLRMLKEVFTAARLPAASKLALEQIYEKTPHENAGVGKCSPETEGSA